MGAACALTLAVLVGVCSSLARPIGYADAGVFPVASGAPRKSSLSAEVLGHQERLVGVHEPSTRSQLELPRPGGQPFPRHQRFEPRHDLAWRPEARFAALTRMRLSCGLPESRGRIADRPVIANCPAQGPPRTA